MAMSQWRSFNSATVSTERDQWGGVYELGDANQSVIYIGSSGEVKTRLWAHLGGSDGPCTQNADYYRVDYQLSYRVAERQRYDEYVRAHGRGPRCNDKRP